MSADLIAFGRVKRLSRRRRSVKRTGNGLPQSGRMASDDKKSTTQRKPTRKRRKSRSSSRKLNSINGEWEGSGEARDTRPRENGFHNTGPKLAICPPVAFQEDLLCRLMQRSLLGQSGTPDDKR